MHCVCVCVSNRSQKEQSCFKSDNPGFIAEEKRGPGNKAIVKTGDEDQGRE